VSRWVATRMSRCAKAAMTACGLHYNSHACQGVSYLLRWVCQACKPRLCRAHSASQDMRSWLR
jgi:hypothetical protein